MIPPARVNNGRGDCSRVRSILLKVTSPFAISQPLAVPTFLVHGLMPILPVIHSIKTPMIVTKENTRPMAKNIIFTF